MARCLLNDFSLSLDPDDDFKYSSGGADILISSESCTEKEEFWKQLVAMAEAVKDIKESFELIKLRSALSAVENFRQILEVVEEDWRFEVIRSEVDCDMTLKPLQIKHLADLSDCIIRRYLLLNLTDTSKYCWPTTWTKDDVVQAQEQNFEGFSDQVPSELVRRLFTEDLQLVVSKSTAAAWVLRFS
jgi:hypothetical protein